MQNKVIPFLLSTIFVLFAGATVAGVHAPADHEKEIVIALKTDDFELVETDISGLAVGESEIIHTDNGKTIDLLRTAEGVEIYVDGELLETGLDHMGNLHEEHKFIHKEIEITCEEGEECEEFVVISDDEHDDAHSGAHAERIIIIDKTVEKSD